MPFVMRLVRALVLLGVLPLAAQGAPTVDITTAAAWQVREIGEGVWLRQRWFPQLFTGPQMVTVLEVHPGAVRYQIMAPGRRTQTSVMAAAAGALAAINGGFFEIGTDGRPRGLLRLDGTLVYPASEGQACLGIDAQGVLQVAARPAGDWPEMVAARGAGPMLVRDGVVKQQGERQRKVRHPRSALGTTTDRRVLCVTVDGRSDKAAGMSLEELATLLMALGCEHALNLDGGGSTTLWVAGAGVCNFPCDNKVFDHAGERAVADAILLHAPAVVVVDDDDAELQGDGWQQHRDGERWHGADFAVLAAGCTGRATFAAELPYAGRWRVLAWAPVREAASGAWLATWEGRAEPVECEPRGGTWVELGEFEVGAGLGAERRASVTLAGVEGQCLLVDAVRFVQVQTAAARR